MTAMLSAMTKTPFSSLIVAISVFAVPSVIRRMIVQGFIRDILLVFPANAVNIQEVLRLSINVQSIFYQHPYAPTISIGIATLIVLVLSSAVAHIAFRNRQTV